MALKHWGRYVGLFTLSVCLVWSLTTPALSQTRLTWEDLQPEATTLQNPYAHLSMEQTAALTSLAALKQWVEENQPGADSFEVQEIQRLSQTLQDQNLEVPTLLSQMEQAQAYWQQRSQSINTQWTGDTVELSGYILPLTRNQAEQVTDFLLVPYVGACIHVPAPPPNQIIYIQPEQPLEVPGLFTAVTVEGELRPETDIYEVFQVDGSRPVEVSYALTLNQLTLATAPTVAPAISRSSGPWWQQVQTRVSGMLTQAVGNVDRQRSPGTFLWGLLIAFSYGVLHTLGPGHGKAVIVAYFIGEGGNLRRGLTMGVRIAVFHVLSAIAVVLLTTLVLRQSAPNNYRVVQLVSYGAISLIGSWMLWRAMPRHHAAPKITPALGATEAELMLYPSLSQQVVSPPAPVACSCLTCIEPKQASEWLSLAIGSVPCTGALLILLYGAANQLLWPSIMMVIAISVGMAITLAWIGTLALMGRNYAESRADQRLGKGRYRYWQQWLRVAGASCVLLLGLGLFTLTLMAGS
ncbi:MAG: DUF3299 domain-containing protein [Cyanobacteria bacterium P01_H01_bin.105]